MLIPKDYQERVKFLTKELLGSDESKYEAIKPVHTQQQIAHNIENFCGDIKIPLGLTGPLNINGEYAKGEFFVPMATTEGTLLASYSRGMKIMNECGGVHTYIVDDYFLRAAILITKNLEDSRKLKIWCVEHEKEIIEKVNNSDPFLTLKKIEYDVSGTDVIVSLYLDTGDAMGSNMGSKAAFDVAQYVEKNCGLQIKNYSPFPEDKKIIPGRHKGKRVVASCQIKNDVLKNNTRASNYDIYEFFNMIKNALSLYGSCSLNIHAVNGLAAMYLAFGQDPAYLGECSQTIVSAKQIDANTLEMSITIPSLIIATIGGGTGLPSAKTCLEIVDCYGPGKAKKLAEIMAAVALAGEISCGAAQCASEFVCAHETMGKNPPKQNNQ